jgi:hypothetical protein
MLARALPCVRCRLEMFVALPADSLHVLLWDPVAPRTVKLDFAREMGQLSKTKSKLVRRRAAVRCWP